MKTTRFLLVSLCLALLCALALPAAATEVSGSLSASSILPGESLSMTVSMGQETVSSLGVTVRCDDGLSVSAGQWLQNGLMASFDLSKNKGVFSPGGATAMSGNIFRVTLDAVTPGSHKVSITLVGKNGTETVFEKTVTKTVQITCPSHSYGGWEKGNDSHWKTCSACGERSEQAHSFGASRVTQAATCTAEGIATQTCEKCGYTKTHTVPATGHTASGWIVDAPAAPGVTGSKHTECIACGQMLQQESIQALPVPETQTPTPTEPTPTEPTPTEPAPQPAEPAPQPTAPVPTEPIIQPTVPESEVPTAAEESAQSPTLPDEVPAEPDILPTQPEVVPTQPETTLPLADAAAPSKRSGVLLPVICVSAAVIATALFFLLRKR